MIYRYSKAIYRYSIYPIIAIPEFFLKTTNCFSADETMSRRRRSRSPMRSADTLAGAVVRTDYQRLARRERRSPSPRAMTRVNRSRSAERSDKYAGVFNALRKYYDAVDGKAGAIHELVNKLSGETWTEPRFYDLIGEKRWEPNKKVNYHKVEEAMEYFIRGDNLDRLIMIIENATKKKQSG